MDRVLVTGISGFIAKHVALALLTSGYQVNGTVRLLNSADAVKKTLAGHGANVSHLTMFAADLTKPEGWREAVKGCRYVQHIASPFPIENVADREALVPTAREGALRVIDAALAEGADRIVMTSSMVAMMYRPNRPAEFTVQEQDWTDAEWPQLSAYIVSKTRAERAAWEHVRSKGATGKLVVVNPGFVLGPALDKDIGTSLGVIELILKRKYPALPPTAFPIVDVRDLAAVHIKGMTAKDAGDRRLVASGDTLSLPDIAAILRRELGPAGRRVPTMTLPAFAVRAMALFDPALRSVLPDLGARPKADSAYVTAMTGISFRPAREAAIDAGRSLVDLGIVPA